MANTEWKLLTGRDLEVFAVWILFIDHSALIGEEGADTTSSHGWVIGPGPAGGGSLTQGHTRRQTPDPGPDGQTRHLNIHSFELVVHRTGNLHNTYRNKQQENCNKPEKKRTRACWDWRRHDEFLKLLSSTEWWDDRQGGDQTESWAAADKFWFLLSTAT